MVVSCHRALPITESSFRERYRFTKNLGLKPRPSRATLPA